MKRFFNRFKNFRLRRNTTANDNNFQTSCFDSDDEDYEYYGEKKFEKYHEPTLLENVKDGHLLVCVYGTPWLSLNYNPNVDGPKGIPLYKTFEMPKTSNVLNLKKVIETECQIPLDAQLVFLAPFQRKYELINLDDDFTYKDYDEWMNGGEPQQTKSTSSQKETETIRLCLGLRRNTTLPSDLRTNLEQNHIYPLHEIVLKAFGSGDDIATSFVGDLPLGIQKYVDQLLMISDYKQKLIFQNETNGLLTFWNENIR